MGSHIERMAAAHQAAIDLAEDEAYLFEEAEEQTHKELTLAFLIALTGQTKHVPAVVEKTAIRPRRIGQLDILTAISDAYLEAPQFAHDILLGSTCSLVTDYLRKLDARRTPADGILLDAAELKMFAESECPHVKTLRVALADAYASIHAAPIAEMEELERAHGRNLQ